MVPSTLPEPVARALLDQAVPGAALLSIRPVPGDFANRLFYLDARAKDGEELHWVVKLFQGQCEYCARQARVEYQALQWLHHHRRPAPEPVFLDDTGRLLGRPGLVTRFLPGSPVAAPPYPDDWGQELARMLAEIHAYPFDGSSQTFLLDANREALWFRKSGSIPDWLADDPDGPLIWETIEALLTRRQQTALKLIHLDFWGGNVLVNAGRITAVLDWGEAGYGEPGLDVAYCLMDLVLCGLDQDADEFLTTYIVAAGGPVVNLALWKLAAAARPIHQPEGWIDRSPARERFRGFVQTAVQEGTF